jgi:hypothetical protein
MDKDNKDFLLALFNKLWDNINNKDSRLWTFLSLYGAGVTVIFTVGKVTNFELYAAVIIEVMTLWALAIIANATWWDIRNRLMVVAIEKKFPTALQGVVPRAYTAIHTPGMDRLNRASAVILALVALTLYLRAVWPLLRAGSVASGDVLLPLLLLYLLFGGGVFWWVERTDAIVREYYKLAGDLESESGPSSNSTDTAAPDSPAAVPFKAALSNAAQAIVDGSRAVAQAQTAADHQAAEAVVCAAEAAKGAAVAQVMNRYGPELARLYRDAARTVAHEVTVAAERAAETVPGQTTNPGAQTTAQAARNSVEAKADKAAAQQLNASVRASYDAKEAAARWVMGWRCRGLAILVITTILFDSVCWHHAATRWPVYLGVLCQAVAGAVFVVWTVGYYRWNGGDPLAYRLKIYEDEKQPTWSWPRNGWPTVAALAFFSGALCGASAVVGDQPEKLWQASPPGSPAELKMERERLADQVEVLRKQAVALEEDQQKSKCTEFITRTEAEGRFAPKADLDAIRRKLPTKKGAER